MKEHFLSVTFRGNNIKIPVSAILYVESVHRKVQIYTADNVYDYYERLDTIDAILKCDGFIRCHQSYLISTDQALSYCNGFILIDAKKIPVSRQHIKKVKEIFANNTHTYGTLCCIKGAFEDAVFQIIPEQNITIGRNGAAVDLPINLPSVSRIHCEIIYHADRRLYELTDLSSYGTFLQDGKRLVAGEHYYLKPGECLCFGDKETLFRLG